MNQLPVFGGTEKKSSDLVRIHAIEELIAVVMRKPNEIRFIRDNMWPLFIEQGMSHEKDTIVAKLEELYGVPGWIVVELIDHLQLLGWIDGVSVAISEDALRTRDASVVKDHANNLINTLTVSGSYVEGDAEVIARFLDFLSNTTLVKQIVERGLGRQDMPRGVLRASSLFDMPYAKFTSLQDYCAFIKENIAIQENLFGDAYASMILENGGLPVDDIKERETTMLSAEKYIGDVGTIEFNGQEYPFNLRVLPGFAPVGIDFALSLTLPTVDGGESNENYFSIVGAYFENGVPVVHTVQSSTHNIGITQAGTLVYVKEPHIPEGTRLLGAKERNKLLEACMSTLLDQEKLHVYLDALHDSHGSDSLKEMTGVSVKNKQDIEKVMNAYVLKNHTPSFALAGFCVLYFLEKGFDHVEIIEPSENLWLMQHNQDRSTDSIKKSGANMYHKLASLLGGERMENGRSMITMQSFVDNKLKKTPCSSGIIHFEPLIRASQQRTQQTNHAVTGVSSIEDAKHDPFVHAYLQSPNHFINKTL